MSLPAVILCEGDSATPRVAGLCVLDRLVVAAHRAGATSLTIVSATPLPELKRAAALGIAVQAGPNLPELSGPTLVLSTRVLVQSADLKCVIAQRGRLVKADGMALPVGIVHGEQSNPNWQQDAARTRGQDARATARSADIPVCGFTEHPCSVFPFEAQLAKLPIVTATGVAEFVHDHAAAAHATQKLWASLTSSADGFVDKHFNRPVGRFLSKVLIHTPISPNQVSVAATLIGLLSAWCFAAGSTRLAIWGAILLQISAIVDCVDGDLARVLFKESPLGKWLDIVGDQVVHIGVFVCIGVGLYRAGSAAPVLPLAASAAIGVVISFVIVMRGLMQPESQRNSRLQKLIDATTNRDFSVLLLMLAFVGKLEWFLWLTAVGVHVFWLLALGLQLKRSPAVATDKSIP